MDLDVQDEDVDGCIQSIHVRNFFCHENLEVNFNRNVNFIVGRNGSGKSAILTALVVGLGGRASATNRGNSLTSFIKNGANSATVEIKIKNSSPRAYKHEVYGDYITVVRNINASGGSSYKIKSATGENKSTKFEEVNAICLAHDIQVDNPISVLNQDDARSFHASDAKKKYSLFRKATNLDQTELNYNRAIDNCSKAKNVLKRKHDAFIELEKEYKKWKHEHEQMQSRDEIEAQKKALQNEYYWSEIKDLERETATVQAQFDKQNARIERLVEKLRSMEQNFGSNSDVIDKLKSELQTKRTSKSSLEAEARSLEAEVRDAQRQCTQAGQVAKKQRELAAREKRNVAQLEAEIQNIDSGQGTSRRADAEKRLSEAQTALTTAQARYATAQNDLSQARANAARAQQQADHHGARVKRHKDKLEQMRQQLRELSSRGNDSLAVYGNNMVELVKRVKQAAAKGAFSAPPRGPIGSYLKVKEKKWGGALEHIIGGSVQAFCVNTADDSRKLFEIMGQVYGSGSKPAVTCSKFLSKQHDVRRNKVRASGFLCALDSLEVADPVVANYLIDNVGMESVLLVPNHDDAVRLSDTEENVPENCAKIVTLDCSEYYPAPNYRSYGGSARQSRFLHLSTAERKAQVEAEIQEAESELRSVENEACEAINEACEARSSEQRIARQLQALMAERHEKEELQRTLQAQLEQLQAPHHAVLLDELKHSQEKLLSLKAQVEQLEAKEQEYRQTIDGNDARLKKIKAKLLQASTDCRTLSEEIEQEQLKIDQGVSERQSCQQKLREDKAKIATVEEILQQKYDVIKAKVDDALQLCERIENPRDKAIVSNELKKTQLKLSSLRAGGLTKAQVAEKLLEVGRKYRRTGDSLTKVKELIAEIKKVSEKHLRVCIQVQTHISRRVQVYFQDILTIRGYSGSMDIDHARSVLEIKCTGRESSSKRHASTTSSLSGGERSYSTVAFIMALWDCVELPFYFLDEFDVFMDNVNRKVVLELLIDHAVKNRSRQYVFLTPQDTAVNAGPQISIHKMADPRP